MKSLHILSWNIMGNTWYVINRLWLSNIIRKRIYKHIIRLLNEMNPDIVCLQEAGEYLPYKLEEYLQSAGFYLTTSARKNNQRFNIIASKFPIVDSGEVAVEGMVHENRIIIPAVRSTCLWADFIVNQSRLRIYNTHLRIRGVGISDRINFLQRVLKHGETIQYPVMIIGDMNTTIPKRGLNRIIAQVGHNEPNRSMFVDGKYYENDERYIFNAIAQQAGFRDILDINQSTWALPGTSWELFKLKLDWAFVKNISAAESTLGPYITDHRPVSIKFSTQ